MDDVIASAADCYKGKLQEIYLEAQKDLLSEQVRLAALLEQVKAAVAAQKVEFLAAIEEKNVCVYSCSCKAEMEVLRSRLLCAQQQHESDQQVCT